MFNKNKNPKLKIFLILISVAILAGIFVIFTTLYAGKVYPGVKIGKYQVGGYSETAVRSLLKQRFEKFLEADFIFTFQNQAVETRGILEFDIDKTVDRALTFGRNQNLFANFKDVIQSLFFKKQVEVSYQLDKERLESFLKDRFSKIITPFQNASLKITFHKDEAEPQIEVLPEKFGVDFDYEKLAKEIDKQAQGLEIKPSELSLVLQEPQIKAQETGAAVQKALKILKKNFDTPLVLNYEEHHWRISSEILADWLEFAREPDSLKIGVGLNKEKVGKYLDSVAAVIEKPVKDARFKFKDDALAWGGKRVEEFQAEQVGLTINREETLKNIEKEVLPLSFNKINIAVQKVFPTFTLANTNKMGIREIVGVGKSSFAGSPKNRRYNIKIGAEKLNGILIKPGEEFSLVKAIGKVDAEAGFLPELVIKENRTIPEYGGGLCQIATTFFRVVLNAGLSVTERTPHTYRVPYYEPAGVDATIYIPKPDFKFINDMRDFLMLQTRVDGNDLIFEFWGRRDGRTVEQAPSRIFNITKPPEPKVIETVDLPVGEKKCIERAHWGADAKFTHVVTYADKTIKETTFRSHYEPWGEVCLIGVAPTSTVASTPSE